MSLSLPPLDLLKGFESAARLLSFTKAAAELFVTQSAVSRQVQTLEDQLGTRLFERGHRQIRLTPAGQSLYRATAEALRLLTDAVAELREHRGRSVTVSCTMGFASLWLIPRLMDFRAEHPGIDIRIAANNAILDLARERIELAVRYCPSGLAPAGAERLFQEEVFPVCMPGLRGVGGERLREPEDLRHHVLLHQEDPEGHRPASSWPVWLEAVGVPRLRSAGSLHFSHYDQLIQAAIDGQGVALGIGPLVRRHLRLGHLVAPFEQRIATPRAYYLVRARHAAGRPEVDAFAAWLMRSACCDGDPTAARRPTQSRTRPPSSEP